MTYGDDHPLDELRRELQEMKGKILFLSAENDKRAAELREIKVMIEERGQHRT